MPFGICAIDNKLSNPFNFLLSIGTPITGILVIAATIPGKCADPPAPAIITEILFFSAVLAYSNILFGVRCAEIIFVSNLIFKILNTFSQFCIVE